MPDGPSLHLSLALPTALVGFHGTHRHGPSAQPLAILWGGLGKSDHAAIRKLSDSLGTGHTHTQGTAGGAF